MSVQSMEVGLKAFDERYYKHRIEHDILESFGKNLLEYSKQINKAIENDESEEHIKGIINRFLQHSFYYDADYEINTYRRADSSIKYKDKLLAIIETKRPLKNRAEMITENDINKKALWEIVFYYLTETRITSESKVKLNSSSEIRRLLITNSRDWFVFNAQDIDKLCDGFLENQFFKYQNNLLSFSSDTDKFYNIISNYFDEINVTQKLSFIYFRADDVLAHRNQWQYMYKILNKAFFLKDGYKKLSESHVLNSKFYKELLYIMGLKEEKKDGKKQILIDNSIENSLIKQTLSIIVNDKGCEESIAQEEAFQLVIIWINRLLFIKLFEGQLLTFNEDAPCYRILDNEKITSFKQLNDVFFDVFGTKDRIDTDFINQFSQIPYLNSSLFERYEIEKKDININSIQNEHVKVKSNSVLGKKVQELPLLEYIFGFLNSYSFSSKKEKDGTIKKKAEIIDASVLGLIFEKINGYKDGSFYTKGFITEYICRETIESTVIKKINTAYNWNCKSIDDLRIMISRCGLDDIKKINNIINSIRICDPSVGSGHFLVSAMNYLLSLKKELGILLKADSNSLLVEYDIAVIDDVLCVYDGQGNDFYYDKNNALSQSIQKTLFNEKREIIENCLFGVDINSNAVAICQLRLWIELLKNAYYENGIMETLPNIDINIKCGNSLMHQLEFEPGKTIGSKNIVGKETESLISQYKGYVKEYKNTSNKSQKQAVASSISNIKNSLRSLYQEMVISANSDGTVFLAWDGKIDNIKRDYFEWAIEFPEIIDDKGQFVGFDCMIGNPPYIRVQDLQHSDVDYYKEKYKTAYKRLDISTLFFELGFQLINKNGLISYITSNQFLSTQYGEQTRKYMCEKVLIDRIINFEDLPVFDDALTYVSIFFASRKHANTKNGIIKYNRVKSLPFKQPNASDYIEIDYKDLSEKPWILESKEEKACMEKIQQAATIHLGEVANCWAGAITGCDEILMTDIDKSLPVEEELQISVIRADGCKRFGTACPTKKIFYPYKETANDTELIPLEDLSKSYPNAYSFIKENERVLKDRKDSRKTMESKLGWYGLIRYGKLSRFKQPKIVSPGEVKHNKFGIDYSGSAFSCARVFSINIEDNAIDLHFLLAILNSKVCEFYLHKNTAVKAGGFYSYSSTSINTVPIVTGSNKEDEIIELTKLIERKIDNNEDTYEEEEKLNLLIYQIYNIDNHQIKVIESYLNN